MLERINKKMFTKEFCVLKVIFKTRREWYYYFV